MSDIQQLREPLFVKGSIACLDFDDRNFGQEETFKRNAKGAFSPKR